MDLLTKSDYHRFAIALHTGETGGYTHTFLNSRFRCHWPRVHLNSNDVFAFSRQECRSRPHSPRAKFRVDVDRYVFRVLFNCFALWTSANTYCIFARIWCCVLAFRFVAQVNRYNGKCFEGTVSFQYDLIHFPQSNVFLVINCHVHRGVLLVTVPSDAWLSADSRCIRTGYWENCSKQKIHKQKQQGLLQALARVAFLRHPYLFEIIEPTIHIENNCVILIWVALY